MAVARALIDLYAMGWESRAASEGEQDSGSTIKVRETELGRSSQKRQRKWLLFRVGTF